MSVLQMKLCQGCWIYGMERVSPWPVLTMLIYKGVSKSFRTESIKKYVLNL